MSDHGLGDASPAGQSCSWMYSTSCSCFVDEDEKIVCSALSSCFAIRQWNIARIGRHQAPTVYKPSAWTIVSFVIVLPTLLNQSRINV